MEYKNKHNNNITNKQMENTSVVRPENLDANNVEFTPLKVNPKTKRLTALMLQRGNGRALNMETPELRVPFGVSPYQKGDTGGVDYSVTFVSQGPNQNDEKAVAWFDELRRMDEMIKEFGYNNRKVIFKKDLPKSVVDELYNPLVKTAVNDNGVPYPPKIQPKFMQDNENPSVLFFKGSSEEPENLEENGWDILMNDVKKGCYARAIVQPRLWFISGKFGCTLKVIQLQIREMVSNRPTKFAFSKNPESDDTERGSASNAAEDAKDAKDSEDSDDAEDADDTEDSEDHDDVENAENAKNTEEDGVAEGTV